MMNPTLYSSLIGKKIKVVLKNKVLDKKELIGTCLTFPPPLIICDLYKEAYPTLSVSLDNEAYTAHISMENIDTIYKICHDIRSKVSSLMICNDKHITNDIALYIIKFMEGWTVDVAVY